MRYLVAVKNTMIHVEVEVPPVLKDSGEVRDYIQNLLGGLLVAAFFEADPPAEKRTCRACQGSGIYRSVDRLIEVCHCLKAIGISRP